MIKRLQFKSLLADRGYLLSLMVLLGLVIVMIVITLQHVRPGDLRVPVKYSQFDPKRYTLGQWFYLLNYLGFVMTAAIAHTLIGAKLYQIKGRQFALGFTYIGCALLFIAIVYSLDIFKFVSKFQ